ncbi:MAG: hypothetical protein AB1752_09060 [Candidatus Zixiibacteriota bacterium]
MPTTTRFLILLAAIELTACAAKPENTAAELLTLDDSTQNQIACGHVNSSNATGWDDGTIFVGDVGGARYHLFVAIRDTAAFLAQFDGYQVDSAFLSIVIASKFGAPGNLNLHFVRRDSTGQGVYPAYNDNLVSYCRSTWVKRKGADPSVCPDSILWQTAGALGALDSDPNPFVVLTAPAAATRHEINVTGWVAGMIGHADSVSNGILLRTSTSNGVGSDFMSIRNIHPFFAGDDRLILKIWYSEPAPPRSRRAYIDTQDMIK